MNGDLIQDHIIYFYKKTMKVFNLLPLLFFAFCSHAQDMKPFIPEGDAKYFDFWEGTWCLLKDDNTIDTSICFKVRRSVNPSSFIEEWQPGALALRAWDKTNNKWGFVWISSNGLYQVWDTKKVDNNWYIYKEFNINGEKYLSRQGFILQPDGTVLRISEKTHDEKTWELRFSQRLKKIKT